MLQPSIERGQDRVEPLQTAESLLDGAFSERAKAFVAAGEELVRAVTAFHGLRSVFDGLSEALSSVEIRDGVAKLEEVARDCGEIHDLIPAQIAAMDGLFDANGSIGKRLEQLRSNIQIVACIAVNARIEASGLRAHSEEMLTFTYEVAQLATTAEETISQYSAEQSRAHQALQNARDLLTQFASTHRTQLMTIAGEIDQNLRSVEQRRAAALAKASHIGERAQEITNSIGKIITALQIADITSQRLAHVHEAVSLLIEGLSAGEIGGEGQWWGGLEPQERRQVAAQVAALQISQIDHTLADLDAEAQSIRSEVSALVDDAIAMARDGQDLYGAGGGQSQSFLGALAERIHFASKLLSDCQAAFSRVGELNNTVGGRFAALHAQTASLQGIMGVVRGVRLIGLNAHLKSDGLGQEGRTLSAISRELRSSADIIGVHARDLIKSIEDTLTEFETVKRNSGTVGASQIHGLVDGMAVALSAFEAGGSSLAGALGALNREGQAVCDALVAARTALDWKDELSTRLAGARDILKEIADSVAQHEMTPRSKSAAAAFFGDRYTMAAERNVHMAKTSGTSQTGSGSATADAGVDDLESIFF
jgi:hypothetical protein